MDQLSDQVHAQYGNHVRVRVCALCFSDDDLLLVWHRGLTPHGPFIAPPGGGLEFGETAEQALYREVEEETGLKIQHPQFLFVHEFVAPPLHAIELFFSAEVAGGQLQRGSDPEMDKGQQLIEQVRFVSPEEILIQREAQFHRMIRYCHPPKALLSLHGYFKFDNKTRN